MKFCEKNLNLLIIATISIITLLCISFLNSEVASSYVYGPNEKPYNKTYQEYAQMHWDAHVNLDPTQWAASKFYKPQKCFFIKIHNKIFLQDFFSESNKDRTFECTIPQLPIVIPALTEGCSDGDFGSVDRNDKKLKDCIKVHNEFATVLVTIDGEVVKNIKDYRKDSDFFLLNVTNPNNIFDNELGSGVQ